MKLDQLNEVFDLFFAPSLGLNERLAQGLTERGKTANALPMAKDLDKPNRLPPGQVWTTRFPVVGERASCPNTLDPEQWRLSILHEETPIGAIGYDQVLALPSEELVCDIHCVTGWSRRDTCFEGVRLATLLEGLPGGIPADTRFVRFAASSSRNHDTSTSLALALEDGWLVYKEDGKPLAPEHGFPMRTVFPSRYFYKSLKWVISLQFLKDNRLGFWERTTGYHQEGRPWHEERLDALGFTSEAECQAFRLLEDFETYRHGKEGPKVIVRGDFRGWNPANRNLRGLQLKLCDFTGACLKGVDLRGANLTFSRFDQADLRGALLSDADLEGCDFCGARMDDTLLSRNQLSAARFMETAGPSNTPRTLQSWHGMKVIEPLGLLEEQEAYLIQIGVMSPLG